MNGESRLIDELAVSKSILSIDGIINTLQNARGQQQQGRHIGYVVDLVNKTLQISVDDLQIINSRSDLRKVAIGFYWHFLTTVFKYSTSQIYKDLPVIIKHRMIYEYGQIIRKAKIENPKTDIDKLVATHHNNLRETILKYKKQNEI